MPSSTSIFFVVIFALEAIMIVIGNTFTIFVFWNQRSRINRTYFLLINLAIADLLVGITELTVLGAFKFEVTLESDGPIDAKTIKSFGCFSTFVSVWNVLSPCYRQSVIAP